MRKILAVIIVAGLLVLALSVPALAGASNPPNAYGQYWKYLNWLDPAGNAIANPGVAPPGQDLHVLIPLLTSPPVFTWGDVVNVISKPAASEWWADNHPE